MDNSIAILSVTAVSIGFIHTILGPDHYLPFIVLSRARKWSVSKTMLITFFCGIGHVLSSVVLGLVGIAVGISVTGLYRRIIQGEHCSMVVYCFRTGVYDNQYP